MKKNKMTIEELNNPESKYIDFKIIKAESNIFYNKLIKQYQWKNDIDKYGYFERCYINGINMWCGVPWFYAVLKIEGLDAIIPLNNNISLNIKKNVEVILYKHKDLEVVRSITNIAHY